MRWLNYDQTYIHNKRSRAYAEKHSSNLLVAFYHRADEAIQGLGSLQRLNIQFVSQNFVVSFVRR
jgi:hypothetical protein